MTPAEGQVPATTSDEAEAEAERHAREQRLHRAWAPPQGWRYWSEVNNDQVGLWYFLTACAFFLFAGVLALLMRVQLAVPENDFLTAVQYDQLMTMHGSVMMFLFAVPIVEAVAVLLIPQLLGTRDLPFPRLSAYGFWCFLIGGVFVCGSLLFGAAPSGGWFMYPPHTTRFTEGVGPDIWLLGLSFIEISSIAAAVELIVGVLKCRAPGMRIHLMPLYAWYILVVAAMVIFAFPPLIVGDLLFELERAFGWPFFDPGRGGDPLLWQHLFWIFGHPEVYIIFLPAVGLVAMIVPTFAARPVVGYTWIVLSAVGVGFLSFGLWVHHMFTTGMPGLSLAFFSAASEAVAIPTGIQIFCFIATLFAGRFVPSVPMLFCAGALAIFVLGGLTGVMVALAPFDFQAHDSYFIVAHLHYVLIGGMLFPVCAGIYYYYPLVTGKLLSSALGRWVFWLMFVGFNVAFLPMHATGLAGMPRRVFTYAPGLGLDTLNLVSTIGAFVLAAGIAVLAFDLVRPRKHLPYAARNPWNAGTLEWLAHMPKHPWSPPCVPLVERRYPLWEQRDFMRRVDEGQFFLRDAEEGVRETLVTSAVDAAPQQCLRMPGPSFVPMAAAVATGGAFIFPTWHWWTPTLVSAVLATGLLFRWLWTGTSRRQVAGTRAIGMGLRVPREARGTAAVGWWAMAITLAADGAAFASLVFAYFYYWTVDAEFPVIAASALTLRWPLLAAACLAVAWLSIGVVRRATNRRRHRTTQAGLVVATLLAAAGAIALLAGPAERAVDPTSSTSAAMTVLMLGWAAAHVALGVLMLLYVLARSLAGRLDADHQCDLANVALYWQGCLLTALIAIAVAAVFPRLA